MATRLPRAHKYSGQLKLLGRSIAAERKALRLTQGKLAELAGCGLTFVNQLERGKPTVRLDKLFAVLEVLGLALTLERAKGIFTSAIPGTEQP